MKKFKSLLLIAFIGGFCTFAQAQAEVSDEELQQFSSVFKEIQEIVFRAQLEMIKAVEEKDLTVQRLNEIEAAHQDPNTKVDASDEEIKKYNSVFTETEAIQEKADQKILKILEKAKEEGLTIDRYQELLTLVRNDPNLQQKLQR